MSKCSFNWLPLHIVHALHDGSFAILVSCSSSSSFDVLFAFACDILSLCSMAIHFYPFTLIVARIQRHGAHSPLFCTLFPVRVFSYFFFSIDALFRSIFRRLSIGSTCSVECTCKFPDLFAVTGPPLSATCVRKKLEFAVETFGCGRTQQRNRFGKQETHMHAKAWLLLLSISRHVSTATTNCSASSVPTFRFRCFLFWR